MQFQKKSNTQNEIHKKSNKSILFMFLAGAVKTEDTLVSQNLFFRELIFENRSDQQTVAL